jgi:hypothetical protein
MAESEVVVFNGVKFRRYPNAKNKAHQRYYVAGQHYCKRGITTLHREVWKAANGPIPPGYDVHHKDGNTLNNALDNLECLTRSEHHKRDSRVSYLKIEPIPYSCEVCGFVKLTRRHVKILRFCSEDCRQVIRRREKRDYAARACVVCGKVFSCFKYSPPRSCSRECALIKRRATMAASREG